jgi:lycopene beta-cyclase
MTRGLDADGIILGGGCAGLALAMALADRGDRRRVIIVEPRTDYSDDRSWCFWAPPRHPWSHRVTRQWPRWLFSGGVEPPVHHESHQWPYQYLRAVDYYAEAQAWIGAVHALELRLGCRAGDPEADSDTVWVETTIGTLTARWLVDTRPPAPTADALLYQCFVGHEVRPPEHSAPDIDCVELMSDMRTDDAGFVFSYILPIAYDRVLVESTRFVPTPAPHERLAADTEALLAARGWSDAPRERHEAAVLPMGGSPVPPTGSLRIVRAGIAGGGLRAASGYGFLRIQAWARRCADALERTGLPVGHPAEPPVRRAMDGLFLRVMRAHPERAEELFQSLARGLGADAFARFMSDRARPLDPLRVVASLPPAPFLRTLVRPGQVRS